MPKAVGQRDIDSKPTSHPKTNSKKIGAVPVTTRHCRTTPSPENHGGSNNSMQSTTFEQKQRGPRLCGEPRSVPRRNPPIIRITVRGKHLHGAHEESIPGLRDHPHVLSLRQEKPTRRRESRHRGNNIVETILQAWRCDDTSALTEPLVGTTTEIHRQQPTSIPTYFETAHRVFHSTLCRESSSTMTCEVTTRTHLRKDHEEADTVDA